MPFSARLSLFMILSSWIAVVRSQNCQLQVPPNPLTAQGLATPYVLTGCNQLDFANQGAFVEAAVLDPATGNIQIYSPLVINAGMMPVGNATGAASSTSASGSGTAAAAGTSASSASSTSAGATMMSATDASSAAPSSSMSTSAAPTATMAARQNAPAGFYIPPTMPTLPNNAVVGIWFGSNAVSLTLTGHTDGCVNGLQNSVFGQFAYCNGQQWFNAAKGAVSQGLVQLPAPGTGTGGQACPTTHDFRVVDQDQSDNVVTTYLLIGGNTLAQNTPANNQANPNAEVLSNASDNALITQFVDPTLGCAPYQNPCTTCPTGKGPALATDELLANFFPPAGGPALVPLNDPMVLVNGQQSLQKVNLYRDGTGQPHADANNASGQTYCQQITQSGIFIGNNQQLFTNAGSPAPATANNLFTFLAQRFSASFGPAPGLGCTGLLNVANPVSLTMDGNGVVTAATINTQMLQQILTGMTGGATTASASGTASTVASSVAAGSMTGSNITAQATTAASTGSAPATTSASAGVMAVSNAGSSTAAPSETGVLLHLSSASSTTSAAALTSASTACDCTNTMCCVDTTTGCGACSTVSVSAATLTPACMGTATVTVTATATATVCSAEALSAMSNGGWNEGGNGRKRPHPWAARVNHARRKNRTASSHH